MCLPTTIQQRIPLYTCAKVFTHFPVDEHLVCFQCLVTINKAAVVFSFLLGKYFGVEWLLFGKCMFNFMRSYVCVYVYWSFPVFSMGSVRGKRRRENKEHSLGHNSSLTSLSSNTVPHSSLEFLGGLGLQPRNLEPVLPPCCLNGPSLHPHSIHSLTCHYEKPLVLGNSH